MRKAVIYIIAIIVLILTGIIYYKYYFVFGRGVKSGYLNYVVEKGYIFKTYEGKLIQEGFNRGQTGAGFQSNEFEFSIANETVFNQLQLNSGKFFDLHYVEYHGKLPWRGNTVYVVDSIINIKDKER